MRNASQEPRDSVRLLIPSLRARIAGYHEQAAHFARLADAEPVEKIRDQLKTLARDYAYLATTLEADCPAPRANPVSR